MLENSFTIKRASELLDCSTQNIYQMKDTLIKLGYWETNETGKYYITEKGLNYLREKRAETIKANSKGFNQVDSKDLSSIATPDNTSNNDSLINILQEQIKELKEEKEYWRKQTEIKDQELKTKNDYIQEINIKAFALLGTAEDNKKQEETTKKGFFRRIFS